MGKSPARVRGVLYASIQEAAAANGRTEQQAQRHLSKYGHLDYLGLKVSWERPDLRRAVTVGGIAFPSVSAAAKALGVDRKTIRNAETSRSAYDFLFRAAIQYRQSQERKR